MTSVTTKTQVTKGISMKSGALSLLILFLSSSASASPRADGIERLAWLQGCWEMVSPQRIVEEQWMSPRGGSMLGMSRTVRGDALVEYVGLAHHQALPLRSRFFQRLSGSCAAAALQRSTKRLR